jgi:MFS family permease
MKRPSVARAPAYAFVVAGVTFLCLLAAAGLRAAPGVLMVPWHTSLGWDRGIISLAAAIGIFLYGLMGPFAAALMQRFGVKRTISCALALIAGSIFLSLFMTKPWQLIATWGVLSGVGSGCVAMVLAATVVNRWFVARRGLMMGLLSASTSTGTLIFLPGMAALAQYSGWKSVVLAIALVTAALVPLVMLLVPDRPADIGAQPYGAPADAPADEGLSRANPLAAAFSHLVGAVRKPNFWFLFGTFFVCGFTTNGLVGTHMISLCADHGLVEVQAAGLLAVMGAFDLVGTAASGWLTDRYDPRKLLFAYYALRGLSLIYLPYSDFSLYGLSLFAVFYGLDWIATVPPTVRLINATFGDTAAPIVFGWIAMGHQLGAASATFLAGVLRTVQGTYLETFVAAGFLALAAAMMSLLIARPVDELRLKPA